MVTVVGPPGIMVDNLGPFPGHFDRTQSLIDVSTFTQPTKPKKDWTHTDSAGHFHAYNIEENDSIITAEEIFVARSVGYGEDYEEWRESVGWSCLLCGEKIPTPARVADYEPQVMRGLKSWSVEFERINEPKLWGKIQSPRRVSIRIPSINGFGIGETEFTGLSNEGFDFIVRGIGAFGRHG